MTNYPKNAIEIENLTKEFSRSKGKGKKETFKALDSVNLEIPRGSIFGLLGPNGAGKSTTINILAGLVIKSSGLVKIWDMDIDNDRRNASSAIGIVPQEINIDPFFNPYDLLELQAGLYGVPKAERRTNEILDIIGLTDKAKSYARNLSGGMRRRLLIGKAMVHNPPILVLDEPTAGVDIELRQQLWNNVLKLNERGVTILLTTHYLEEAEQLCDRIAIINHGKVVANDSKRNLLRKLDSKTLVLYLNEEIEKDNILFTKYKAKEQKTEDGYSLEIQYTPSSKDFESILAAATNSKATIVDLSTKEADLEDIFLQMTRK